MQKSRKKRPSCRIWRPDCPLCDLRGSPQGGYCPFGRFAPSAFGLAGLRPALTQIDLGLKSSIHSFCFRVSLFLSFFLFFFFPLFLFLFLSCGFPLSLLLLSLCDSCRVNKWAAALPGVEQGQEGKCFSAKKQRTGVAALLDWRIPRSTRGGLLLCKQAEQKGILFLCIGQAPERFCFSAHQQSRMAAALCGMETTKRGLLLCNLVELKGCCFVFGGAPESTGAASLSGSGKNLKGMEPFPSDDQEEPLCSGEEEGAPLLCKQGRGPSFSG